MKNVNMVIISILLYYNLHKSIVNYNIIRLLTIGHMITWSKMQIINPIRASNI